MSTALLPAIANRPMAGAIQASMSLPILPFQRRNAKNYGNNMKSTGSLPDILEALGSYTSGSKPESFANDVTSGEAPRPRTISLDDQSASALVIMSNGSPSDSSLPAQGDNRDGSDSKDSKDNIVIDENNNVVEPEERPRRRVSQPQVASPAVDRRRKNSSMTPIIPDMDELEKLRADHQDHGANKPYAQAGNDPRESAVKTPKLIQCGESFCKFFYFYFFYFFVFICLLSYQVFKVFEFAISVSFSKNSANQLGNSVLF